MIFNEIYSAYYNTVAKIITAVLNGCTDEKTLNAIVCDNAFGESMLTVLPSLKAEKWQLIRKDMTTPLKHSPTMPLTTVQKQWLKSLSLDPRIRLFGVEISGLEDVEPLFTPDDYRIYDKYGNGDPYGDEGYIERFQYILTAIHENQPLKIRMVTRKGNTVSMNVLPKRLEYSEKDDKFRLICTDSRYVTTINLGRIIACEKCSREGIFPQTPVLPESRTVTLRISDDRNALERCLLHFAHFEKRAERINENQYLVHIKYDRNDETEMVIRILSFGPMAEVTEPKSFRELIINRLKSQKSCELK